MSKILMKKLDELEAISFLFEEIPLSYQDKIDLRRTAIQAMKITDKLIERLDPAFISPIIKDENGKECDYREFNGRGAPCRKLYHKTLQSRYEMLSAWNNQGSLNH